MGSSIIGACQRTKFKQASNQEESNKDFVFVDERMLSREPGEKCIASDEEEDGGIVLVTTCDIPSV